MAYKEAYRNPGVDLTYERSVQPVSSTETNFYPIFIGSGQTCRARVESLTRVKANFTEYPNVILEYPVIGNSQMFADTDFKVKDFRLYKEVVAGQPVTELVIGDDIEIVTPVQFRESSNTYRTVIKVVDEEKITKADLYFDFKVELENDDYDFVPRLLTADDQYRVDSYLGKKMLMENGVEIRNDLAFAAELAFKVGAKQFYYLEVPRDYGQVGTKADYERVLEEIFFVRDAYRIVPLTYDLEIIKLVTSFATSVSNPNDKRQLITFFASDPARVTDIRDISSWIDSVGTLSESLNTNRAYHVAGITKIALSIGGQQYDLPLYFLAVAIAAFDTVNGMSKPISTVVLDVFDFVEGPRFRPKTWNKLARYGVFLCYKDDVPYSKGITIHHQLSTSQNDDARDQELSVIKNLDGTVVYLRDVFKPYAGRTNITPELITILDGVMAQAIDTIINKKNYMTTITVNTPWSVRTVPSPNGDVTKNKRALLTMLSGDPAYPANNLDIVFAL